MNWSIRGTQCVVLCLLSLRLTEVTAFAGTASEEPGTIVERLRRANAAYNNQTALETYEKRNSKMTVWGEDTAPPNQGNAALLYYQAFLLRPETSQAIDYRMNSGAEIDKEVRTYLGYCLPVIEIAEVASRMPKCIWGAWPERGLSLSGFQSEVGKLRTILLVDAKTLAVDGHYPAALGRCLTVRRLARQLSEDPELYRLSTACDRQALATVRDVLGVMPPHVEILTWFRGQFAVVQGAPPSFAKELTAFAKAELNHIRTHPARLSKLKSLLVEKAENRQGKQNGLTLTDEQILSRANEGLQRFIDSVLGIVDSEMNYEQKQDAMQRFINKLKEPDGTDPITRDIISEDNMGGLIDQWHSDQVMHQAYINSMKTALEVYLIVAKTGQLPDKLPDYLPKDPFTGRDFVYEKTDEGFALRCQGEEFLSGKNRWLEFKVHK